MTLLLLGLKFHMSSVNNFGKTVRVVLWKFNGRPLINRFDKKNTFKTQEQILETVCEPGMFVNYFQWTQSTGVLIQYGTNVLFLLHFLK